MLRFECGQPSQKKTTKVEFNEERDAADEPGDHDEDRQLRMRRGLEKRDVIAQVWIDREDDQGIQTAEQQAGQESPAEAIPDFSFSSPSRDTMSGCAWPRSLRRHRR